MPPSSGCLPNGPARAPRSTSSMRSPRRSSRQRSALPGCWAYCRDAGPANAPRPREPHLASDPPGRGARDGGGRRGAGAGLFLRLSPALIGGPSNPPSIAPVPSSSVAPSPSPSPVPDRNPPTGRRDRLHQVRGQGQPDGSDRLEYGSSAQTEPVATSCSPMARASRAVWPGRRTGRAWSTSSPAALYLTDANGSEPQLLDTGCARDPASERPEPAFSPDGTQLVFEHGATRLHRNHGPRERSGRGAGFDGSRLQRATPVVPRREADRLLPPGQVRKRLRRVRRRRGRPEPPPAQLRRAPCPPCRLVPGRLADRLHVPRRQVRQGGRDEHPRR